MPSVIYFNSYLCYLTEYLPLSTYQFGQTEYHPSVLSYYLQLFYFLILFNKLTKLTSDSLLIEKLVLSSEHFFYPLTKALVFFFFFPLFGAKGIIFFTFQSLAMRILCGKQKILFKCCLINE